MTNHPSSSRRTLGAAFDAAHIAALGVWIGVIGATGLFAAAMFHELRALNPTIPAYALYTGAHWRIGGGQVANRVFDLGDTVQIGAMVIAAACFIGACAANRRSLSRIPVALHAAGVFAASALLATQLAWLRPEMDRRLSAYWNAASAGENERAVELRGLFDDLHPIGTNLMIATGVAALASVVFAAWSMSGAGRREEAAT